MFFMHFFTLLGTNYCSYSATGPTAYSGIRTTSRNEFLSPEMPSSDSSLVEALINRIKRISRQLKYGMVHSLLTPSMKVFSLRTDLNIRYRSLAKHRDYEVIQC